MAKDKSVERARLRERERRERRRQWRAVFAEQRKSDLSHREFCQRQGIPEHQYYWWKRQLRGAATVAVPRERRKPSESAFVEVKVSPSRVEPQRRSNGKQRQARFEVVLRGNRRLRFGADFDQEVLKELVRTLEAIPC